MVEMDEKKKATLFIYENKLMKTIDKYSADMSELIIKFNESPFITQEFYEEYEFALMEFANCLATEKLIDQYWRKTLDKYNYNGDKLINFLRSNNQHYNQLIDEYYHLHWFAY